MSKFEKILRLGFSSQYFIILYLYGFGLFLIYFGLYYLRIYEINVWIDPFFIIILGVIGVGGSFLFTLLGKVTAKVDLWPSGDMERSRKLKVFKLRSTRMNTQQQLKDMGIEGIIRELFIYMTPLIQKQISERKNIFELIDIFNKKGGSKVIPEEEAKNLLALHLEEINRNKSGDKLEDWKKDQNGKNLYLTAPKYEFFTTDKYNKYMYRIDKTIFYQEMKRIN